MGCSLARGTRRFLLGVLAVGCVLAGVTVSGAVAAGKEVGVRNLAGVWDVTFRSPPCVVGCGSRPAHGPVVPADTWTFTRVRANTYDIANDEGFHALSVVVSGGAFRASAKVCWTAPPVPNSDCPGGRSPGAGYGTQTMKFVFRSKRRWKITGEYSAYSPTGTLLPPVLPYTATIVVKGRS